MSTLLLKNGTVIDYVTKTNEVLDVFIEDGKISKLGKELNLDSDRVIDCTGLYIIPGMIDMHCHLREPGGEHKETIETGSKSAVKGGFTTICPMPNTNPTPDSAIVLQKVIAEAKRVNLCNVRFYSSVTKGEKGEELVDFKSQLEAGAVAFSDDGVPVKDARMVREAMIKANEVGSFISEHCEEKSVSSGAINAGPIAEKLGVEGVLPEAEEIMAGRDAIIAEQNKIHTHICHISTEVTANIIRAAKQRGVKVTCETCTHHFSLTEDEVLNSGVNAKMNPPLRSESDRLAIIKGLQDGTIDAIVTDHAPHTKEEKDRGLVSAPNGIIGFETALAATITNLIVPGYISYLDMVKLTSYNPSKLLGLDRGEIAEGKIADLTIFDPNKKYTYTEDMIVSKSHNTPWIGKELQGENRYTIVSGRVVYEK